MQDLPNPADVAGFGLFPSFVSIAAGVMQIMMEHKPWTIP